MNNKSEIINPLNSENNGNYDLFFQKKISEMPRLDRADMMALCSDVIGFLHHRSCGIKFREQQGDRARVAYLRVLVGAIQAYTALLRDEDMEDLKHRIEALERLKEVTS